MNIFSDQCGILSSFNGPYQPRAPRLFKPIDTKQTGFRDPTTRQYDNMKCGTCDRFAGDGSSKAPNGLTWRDGKPLCIACAEKEKKCNSPVMASSTTSTEILNPKRLSFSGHIGSSGTISPPLESDWPETRGWIYDKVWNNWKKGDYACGHYLANTWWCCRQRGGTFYYINESGIDCNKCEYGFPSVQAIDALLFPQREFKVGEK